MPNLKLKIPPGLTRPGTVYDAMGRWFDANLVRWTEGVMQPIGGWARLSGSPKVDGPPRAVRAWRDNVQHPCLALGTPNTLWLLRGGVLADISPVDGLGAKTLKPGRADADMVSGQYGAGAYGDGAYGTGSGVGVLEPATVWALDTYGEALVACSPADGRILFKGNPSTATAAEVLANAPTGCKGVVVTPERFIVALGVGGDLRRIQWSDQDNPTFWNMLDATKQAGDFNLTTPGALMAARRSTNETLLWTDADLWRMRFIGGQFVYSVTQVGSSCGAISQASMAVLDGKAIWMGTKGFFAYDGFVKPLVCEVSDYVFSSLNKLQRSKVAVYTRAQYGEVTWHYPSAASVECDRYVTYNYRENHWTLGVLQRTSGEDADVFGFPLAVDAAGFIYEHEVHGGEYAAHNGALLTPYIESGPIELGAGDNVLTARALIPDVVPVDGLTASIFSSIYPVTAETRHGPFTLTPNTPVRLTGRQVRLRLDAARATWRAGTMRLEVVPGGLR